MSSWSRVARAGLVALALGCGEEDRIPQLRAELQQLREQRIERETVARARAEADQAEADLERARERHEAAQAHLEEVSERLDRLQSSLQAAAQRNSELHGQIQAEVDTQEGLAERAAALAAQKVQLKARALFVRDQALVLLESLERSDRDPPEVLERRRRAVAEFLGDVRARFEPEANGSELPEVASAGRIVSPPGPLDLRSGLERVSSHFAERFELPEPAAKAEP